MGAEISFGVGTQSVEIRAKCLRKNLPLVLGLVAAELRTPALQAAEFAKAKQQFIGSLQESLQNTEGRAQEAFGRAIFPEGPSESAALDRRILGRGQERRPSTTCRAFHAKYYGPAHLTLGAGRRCLPGRDGSRGRQGFRGLDRRPGLPASGPAPRRPPAPHEITVPLNDKPSVSVILGQATGLRYRDPDSLALRIGTAILGRGFTGRLMGTVRDKEGLTYNIGAADER